jgi:chorismate mutase
MDNEMLGLRENIDKIDEELVALFGRRMKITKEIGDYKREHNLAIYDAGREQSIVKAAVGRVPDARRREV